MVTKDDLDSMCLRIQDSVDGLAKSVNKLMEARHCINGVRLYDNADLLQMFPVSRNQIYKWCAAEKLRPLNIQGKHFYTIEEIQRFIREEL